MLHSSLSPLQPFLQKYPSSAPSLIQAYSDLLFTQHWTELTLLDLPVGRVAISGHKPTEQGAKLVLPCSLDESLSLHWLSQVFAALGPQVPELYLGIVSPDSSIVYYKISKGIVKPPM
ncbi:hypothetical protein DACRYDRAFT_118593 [Dacryopinax primogenitus]|uniref:tRNA-splicing endonuclease subunit Sen15 domain-containing protein n=1 Tax=Dacryopinax primogenitus (strain DJM 731) TaxID=1858805 RepID=M5G502_DACPD|nr:uncharacterized protein DACRYDRAFT_118593 [Dacryopinax primogenitus]EJT98832.1 hypothetical protein DACRYDRAFT_118593 [Dacryopinax primogenitus]